jgi:hypothetical protein
MRSARRVSLAGHPVRSARRVSLAGHPGRERVLPSWRGKALGAAGKGDQDDGRFVQAQIRNASRICRDGIAVAGAAQGQFQRPISSGSSTSACLALSIDHDLNRVRKLWPSSRLPSAGAIAATTFSIKASPTFNDRRRNITDGTVDPSASL